MSSKQQDRQKLEYWALLSSSEVVVLPKLFTLPAGIKMRPLKSSIGIGTWQIGADFYDLTSYVEKLVLPQRLPCVFVSHSTGDRLGPHEHTEEGRRELAGG